MRLSSTGSRRATSRSRSKSSSLLALISSSAALFSLVPAATVLADYAYPDPQNAFAGYDLVIDEPFNGPTLNSSLWTPDWDCSGWGNGMRAAYTTSPKNLYIQDGILHLNPICGRLQPDKSICQPFSGYPECACEPTNFINIDATGAQITTRHKFAFNRGRFRIRAKMSTGYYTWPAFWLYKDWKPNEEMPIGEIDIMEGVGKRPQWWTAVIHYLQKDSSSGEIKDKVRNNNADWTSNLNDDYHVYGLDWTDGQFVWTIDETVMWKLDYAKLFSDPNNINVFDDGFFYMILDIAVGGRMFGIGYGNNKPDYGELCADGNTFTPTQIDWLRLYQLKGKHNYTTGAGQDIVGGSNVGIASEGAACPFGGCVGSSWEDRVDAILGTSRTRTTTTSKTTTTTTKKSKTSKTSSSSTSTSTVEAVAITSSRPSGAGPAMQQAWTTLGVFGAAVAAVFAFLA